MALTLLKNTAGADLGAASPVAVPLGEPVAQTRAYAVERTDQVETGIWECTPGRFTADRTEIAEICHILTGRMTLHNGDGTSREIGAGEMFVLPHGWRGEWTIHERTRKIYTMVAKGV